MSEKGGYGIREINITVNGCPVVLTKLPNNPEADPCHNWYVYGWQLWPTSLKAGAFAAAIAAAELLQVVPPVSGRVDDICKFCKNG